MKTDEIQCETEKHPVRQETFRLKEKCYHCLPPDGPAYVDDCHDGKEKWNAEGIEEMERNAWIMFSCGCWMDDSMRQHERESKTPKEFISSKRFFILQNCPEHRHREEDYPYWDEEIFGDGLWARRRTDEGPLVNHTDRLTLDTFEGSSSDRN